MIDWIECQNCGTEFRVVSDTDVAVQFCPYCGEEIDHPIDNEDDDYWEEG